MKEAIIAVGIILVAVIIGIAIIVILKRKYSTANVQSNTPKDFNLEIKKPYLSMAELKFLETLNKILPFECVAFPKVGVDTLVAPKGDKLGFNAITGNYVDICVFLIQTMEPLLVIELVEENTLKQGLKVMNTNTIKALNAVKIPIIKYAMSDKIDKDDLKTKVLKSMKNDVLVSLITKK